MKISTGTLEYTNYYRKVKASEADPVNVDIFALLNFRASMPSSHFRVIKFLRR